MVLLYRPWGIFRDKYRQFLLTLQKCSEVAYITVLLYLFLEQRMSPIMLITSLYALHS